jgi:hypothetical protein
MIGKIVKGTSFSGCVNYVLKEDKSRLLKAVGVYGSPEEIAEQFELQTLLNDKVKNKVGHISLSFSAEDGDRIRDDDGLMLKIAHDYMKLMGIENTQFIIARHTDRDHPHCHIVYNRVDNDGRTISDKNDRYRNEKVCKMCSHINICHHCQRCLRLFLRRQDIDNDVYLNNTALCSTGRGK